MQDQRDFHPASIEKSSKGRITILRELSHTMEFSVLHSANSSLRFRYLLVLNTQLDLHHDTHCSSWNVSWYQWPQYRIRVEVKWAWYWHVLTLVSVVLTIVLHRLLSESFFTRTLTESFSPPYERASKVGVLEWLICFFFEYQQKKSGAGKSWRMVRETFLRGIYTVLELRAYDRDPHFFRFLWDNFKKQFFIHKGSRTHFHIRYSFPFCRNISHHCSPDTYAIHFRAPGTYAIRFRSPDTDSIHLHPTWLLSILSFSQACTQT